MSINKLLLITIISCFLIFAFQTYDQYIVKKNKPSVQNIELNHEIDSVTQYD